MQNKDSFKITTGEQLKQFRLECEMSVKELSELLNCSEKAVWQWERGQNRINGTCLILINIYEKYGFLKI